ncbi:MAG TPA: hypothetical protein G4O06_08160, partial [Dehalococcoidia bacterium]|nr:hypothetical protein [Dehalococcoidia bacterium]
WKFPQKLVVFIKNECVLVKLPRGQSDLEMVVVERKKFVVCLALQGKSAFSFIVQQHLEQFSDA